MRITGTVTGVDAARRSIAAIDPKVRAAAKRGVSKANKVALREVKSSLRNDATGLLRKSLGDKVKVSGTTVYGVIGPRLGFRTTITAALVSSRGLKFIGFRGRKGSEKVRQIKFKAARSLAIGDVVDPAKYASFIEFGHRKGRGHGSAPAYPFIRPARDRVAGQIPGIVAAEINAAVHQGGVGG